MDIRMENWYWTGQHQDDLKESKRIKVKRQRRHYARWMKWARRILLAEMFVIGFEGLYQFGRLIRGYNSFGGESILLIALAGCAAWHLRKIIK